MPFHEVREQAEEDVRTDVSFARLLSSRRRQEADMVRAMVAARVVAPHTKLATARWWQTRILAEDLGVRAIPPTISTRRGTGC